METACWLRQCCLTAERAKTPAGHRAHFFTPVRSRSHLIASRGAHHRGTARPRRSSEKGTRSYPGPKTRRQPRIVGLGVRCVKAFIEPSDDNRCRNRTCPGDPEGGSARRPSAWQASGQFAASERRRRGEGHQRIAAPRSPLTKAPAREARLIERSNRACFCTSCSAKVSRSTEECAPCVARPRAPCADGRAPPLASPGRQTEQKAGHSRRSTGVNESSNRSLAQKCLGCRPCLISKSNRPHRKELGTATFQRCLSRRARGELTRPFRIANVGQGHPRTHRSMRESAPNVLTGDR